MKTHHKSSKRQALNNKYNIQKKIREHRRRMKKMAKKMGLSKRVRRDPGIPNSWPFKAEMLQELEEKKEKRDEEMAERHANAKNKTSVDLKQKEIDKRENQLAREAARLEKAKLEAERWHLQAFKKTLPQSDILLHVLDSRDPLSCRCAELEAWAQKEKKRIIFVLAKADLITPDAAAKWLHVLGQVAPTVVVQAEAGREGIRELLALLGHAPPTTTSASQPSVPPAKAVGVLGYKGTGKRNLCKAIRQELKATAPWLLDACRLRPAEEPKTVGSALHAAICANVPRGAANATSAQAIVASGSGATSSTGVEPVDVVKEFLTKVPLQGVLRHFRLPAFEGVEGFMKAFREDRKLKTKKGKIPQPAVVAQRILAELPALPGCFCSPPEASTQAAQNFWPLHSDAKQNMQLLMQAQVQTLSARGISGPAATALAITSSAGPGPCVDIEGTLEDDEGFIEGEDDVSDSNDGSDEDMSMSGMEGEEEEECEGEESEEMSDDE